MLSCLVRRLYIIVINYLQSRQRLRLKNVNKFTEKSLPTVGYKLMGVLVPLGFQEGPVGCY